jgi:hypothetical protein
MVRAWVVGLAYGAAGGAGTLVVGMAAGVLGWTQSPNMLVRLVVILAALAPSVAAGVLWERRKGRLASGAAGALAGAGLGLLGIMMAVGGEVSTGTWWKVPGGVLVFLLQLAVVSVPFSAVFWFGFGASRILRGPLFRRAEPS